MRSTHVSSGLDGSVSAYPGDGFAPGSVTEFSSFGTLADGTNLPHVCAPGSTIISSISNPYLKNAVDVMGEEFGIEITDDMRREYEEYLCQGRATVNGANYYWSRNPALPCLHRMWQVASPCGLRLIRP